MCVCACVCEVRCLVKLQWKHTLIELFHSAVNKQKSKVAAALPVLHGEFVRYATSSSSSGQTDVYVCVCVSACVRISRLISWDLINSMFAYLSAALRLLAISYAKPSQLRPGHFHWHCHPRDKHRKVTCKLSQDATKPHNPNNSEHSKRCPNGPPTGSQGSHSFRPYKAKLISFLFDERPKWSKPHRAGANKQFNYK